VAFAALFVAAFRGFGDVGAKLRDKRAVVIGTGAELFGVRGDFALDARCAHAAYLSVSRKALPLA
jgi:hypothetical protein